MDKRVKKWMSTRTLSLRQKNLAHLMNDAGYGYTCMIRHLLYIEGDENNPATSQAERCYKRLLEGVVHGRVGKAGISRRSSEEYGSVDEESEESEESSEEVSHDNESLTDTRWNVYSTEELIQAIVTDKLDPIMRAQLVAIISE